MAGVGEPLRFPRGSEARTPQGGRPGGQQPPRFWGPYIPARRAGFSPGRGRVLSGAEGELLWRILANGLRESQAVPRGGAVASSWGVARPKARSAPGGLPFPRPAGRSTGGEGD